MQAINTQEYVIREGRADDAEQLAGFFREIYGNSSHQCRVPEHVRESIERHTTEWFVAAQGSSILACAANVLHPWNRTYETCRLYSREDRAIVGLGRRIYREALVAAYASQGCEMQWGTPRSYGVYLIAHRERQASAIFVGHDGGMHVAAEGREYHVFALTRNPHRSIPRVLPPSGAIATSPFVTEQVTSHLSFATNAEEYPAPYFVGPTSSHQARIDECVFHYDYEAASPGRALQITNVATPRADAACVAEELARFLAAFPAVPYVNAVVLIDKLDLLRRMRALGFDVTAYLPAWYLLDGKRYDCVMLVRRGGTEEPIAHGTREMIDVFTANLNDLVDRAPEQ